MDLRNLVKARFASEGLLDSWAIQCATKLGMWKRKLSPDGTAIFGGRAAFERRRKGLISKFGSWHDVHRTIKAAKIGYRRPHPDVPLGARGSDVHGTELFRGHAVVRLGRRHRPGLLFRLASLKSDAAVRTFANVDVSLENAVPHENPNSRK